jgi:hypothetical protein
VCEQEPLASLNGLGWFRNGGGGSRVPLFDVRKKLISKSEGSRAMLAGEDKSMFGLSVGF